MEFGVACVWHSTGSEGCVEKHPLSLETRRPNESMQQDFHLQRGRIHSRFITSVDTARWALYKQTGL